MSPRVPRGSPFDSVEVGSSLAPLEGILKVDELPRLAGHQVDTDDVEADGGPLGQRQLPKVLRGQPSQGVALVAVDGGFGRSHVPRGARLHFDEAEQGSTPGDQVDIAGTVAGRPAPRDQDVSFATQEKEGRIFALNAGGKVVRNP